MSPYSPAMQGIEFNLVISFIWHKIFGFMEVCHRRRHCFFPLKVENIGEIAVGGVFNRPP